MVFIFRVTAHSQNVSWPFFFFTHLLLFEHGLCLDLTVNSSFWGAFLLRLPASCTAAAAHRFGAFWTQVWRECQSPMMPETPSVPLALSGHFGHCWTSEGQRNSWSLLALIQRSRVAESKCRLTQIPGSERNGLRERRTGSDWSLHCWRWIPPLLHHWTVQEFVIRSPWRGKGSGQNRTGS